MVETTVDWPALLAQLAEPFPTDQVRWRAGTINRDKTKAAALAYVEPRAYEDRLNTLCPGDWQVDFQPWGDNRIICHLTIHGVTRSSTGEAGDSNPTVAGTSAEAQAFKRACSKFGLGRYLYDLPTTWVAYDPTTKKLLETPKLPAAPKAVRMEPKPSAAVLPAPGTPIGKARAATMHRELTRLGLSRNEHYTFASRVLGQPIDSFADLDEVQARHIYTATKDRLRQANGRSTARSQGASEDALHN